MYPNYMSEVHTVHIFKNLAQNFSTTDLGFYLVGKKISLVLFSNECELCIKIRVLPRKM